MFQFIKQLILVLLAIQIKNSYKIIGPIDKYLQEASTLLKKAKEQIDKDKI